MHIHVSPCVPEETVSHDQRAGAPLHLPALLSAACCISQGLEEAYGKGHGGWQMWVMGFAVILLYCNSHMNDNIG